MALTTDNNPLQRPQKKPKKVLPGLSPAPQGAKVVPQKKPKLGK